MYTPKYNYNIIDRVETPTGRCYSVAGQLLPSVTTILSKTKDNSGLLEWIHSVGEEKANRIKTEASLLGTDMHASIERHLLDKSMSGTLLSKSLAGLIIKKGLSNVNEVWGIETALYFDGLYAGTTDMIGVHNGKPSIIDFKNSLRYKEKEYIEDYFLQCCAYAMAHNNMYDTDIQKGVIMIATRDAKYQEFIIEDTEFSKYTDIWLKRLEDYYKN